MELYIPTHVFHGKGCIAENAHRFATFGKKALIVTGKNSAKASGALQDVTNALAQHDIAWKLFDEVENNPSVTTCYRGGQIAKEFGADFIVAIGGGSPMDAAKAIAAYAANDISPMALFDAKFENPLLPLIAVPLTAGTGSEVTPYSILTVPEIENKKNFAHPDCFPKLAFLDPAYLQSLSHAVLLDTTADALSHALESMLCKRSSPASCVYAEAALKYLSKAIPGVVAGTPDYETLLLASCLAGMAISHTGTVVVHSMGYMLTYYKNVPHGRANALLLPRFIELCQEHVPERLEPVLKAFGAKDSEELCNTIRKLTAKTVKLTDDEVSAFAAKAFTAKNVTQNLWPLTEAEEASAFATLQ